MWEFRWPIIGIIIPCALIGGIGYGSHVFVFRHHMGQAAQLRYEIYVTMVWISYALAIFKSPGTPPRNYKVPSSLWKKWCKKCKNYKPERAHHCRKCGTCVLQMDHHCPWTNNCVGHANTPHFMRFLIWIMFTTGVTLVELSKRAIAFYNDMHLPAYLISKTELTAVIILLPLDFFVLFAVSVLFLRCIIHIACGKTQIEVWESERIESQFHTEKLWLKIRYNYSLVHGKKMPKLTSWNFSASKAEEIEFQNLSDNSEDPVVPRNFTFDDLIFPYDLGICRNIVNSLGSPWSWLLPWGSAKGDGVRFAQNDDDDQLNLPWPPDAGNVEYNPRKLTDEELRNIGDVTLIRRHLDPRSNMSRIDWINDMGEGLIDYGVDIDAEEEKGLSQYDEVHTSSSEL